MKHIPQTNQLLADIREGREFVPRHKIIKGELRERIFSRIEQEENSTGYVDFITLSSSILFSMKYKLSVQDMRKELYTTIYARPATRNVRTISKGWKSYLAITRKYSTGIKIFLE